MGFATLNPSYELGEGLFANELASLRQFAQQKLAQHVAMGHR
jgi:hypothetical protein